MALQSPQQRVCLTRLREAEDELSTLLGELDHAEAIGIALDALRHVAVARLHVEAVHLIRERVG